MPTDSAAVADPRTAPGRAAAWFATLVTVAWKELLVLSRYPVEFLASFLQTFLMIAIFTLAALTFAPEGDGGGVARAELGGLMVYGFILFIFLTETLWSLGYSVRREQRQGTLEQLYLSPASRSAVLVSRSFVTLATTGLVAVLSVALMAGLIGELPLANPGPGLVVLLFTLSGTFGIGFAFAALTLRVRETAQSVATLLQFAFMVVCAPFFPFSVLPGWLEGVARAIPLSYGVDAFRSLLMGMPAGFPELAPLHVEIPVVVAFGVLMPWLGLVLYRRQEERSRADGTLSEY